MKAFRWACSELGDQVVSHVADIDFLRPDGSRKPCYNTSCLVTNRFKQPLRVVSRDRFSHKSTRRKVDIELHIWQGRTRFSDMLTLLADPVLTKCRLVAAQIQKLLAERVSSRPVVSPSVDNNGTPQVDRP